jgi:hypothetical protein
MNVEVNGKIALQAFDGSAGGDLFEKNNHPTLVYS